MNKWIVEKMSCFTTALIVCIFCLQLSYCGGFNDYGGYGGYGDFTREETAEAEKYRIITEVYSKLDLNETREFLSSFNSTFERDSLYQQLQACPFTALCEYNLSLTFEPSTHVSFPCCEPCTCDYPNCLQKQTCCLDILYRNAMVTDETTKNANNTTTKNCMRLSLTGSTDLKANSRFDVKANAECPLNTTLELGQNCTKIYASNLRELKDFTPVYDVRTLDLYRNAYCAYCNNVTDDHLAQVSVGLECHKADQFKSELAIIQSVMNKQECNMTFKYPEFIRPEVCEWEVSECNITGIWLDYDPDIERACTMYKSTIIIGNAKHRNIFCALCNGINNNNKTGCSFKFGYSGTSFAFTGLLKLGAYNTVKRKQPENNNCTLQQLYDSVYDVCRDLFCPPHQTLQDGQCLDIYTSLRAIIYTIVLKVVPRQTTTVLQGDSLADNLIETIRQLYFMSGGVCGIQMAYTVDEDLNAALNATDIIRSVVQYFIVRIEVSMYNYHDPNKFVELILILDQLDIGVIYHDETSQHMQTFQGQLKLYSQESEMFDHISNLSVSMLNHWDNPERTLETIITNFSHTGDNSVGIQFPHLTGRIDLIRCAITHTKVNILQMRPCTTVKLSKNDTQWVHSSNGITLIRGDYTLKNSEFYIEDKDTIVVCTHVYRKYMSLQTNVPKELGMSIETVLSVVCSSMSILCLSFTFLAFCMLSKLRKQLPGINNMVLVVVLLSAQSMYLVAGVGVLDIASIGCAAFGLVLHFIWLLSMFWMNVCTYHMFHVLTNMTTVLQDSRRCRFVVYLLYAIIMSSVPVAVNIAMSNATFDSLGYGQTICYISSQKMITYTFVVPSAFVIVTNLCMFVYVMVKIKRTSMVKNTVNHERNNLLIFVKLSTITGITWVFGFIYSWTDIIVFSYLFILLNAGQGVFIMLAFIFNSRVLNMFKSDVLRHSFVSSSGDINIVNTSKQCNSRNGSNTSVEHTKL